MWQSASEVTIYERKLFIAFSQHGSWVVLFKLKSDHGNPLLKIVQCLLIALNKTQVLLTKEIFPSSHWACHPCISHFAHFTGDSWLSDQGSGSSISQWSSSPGGHTCVAEVTSIEIITWRWWQEGVMNGVNLCSHCFWRVMTIIPWEPHPKNPILNLTTSYTHALLHRALRLLHKKFFGEVGKG